MIRLIFRETNNSGVACGALDEGDSFCKSFDVDLPEIEQWLTEKVSSGMYIHRQFLGIELLESAKKASKTT